MSGSENPTSGGGVNERNNSNNVPRTVNCYFFSSRPSEDEMEDSRRWNAREATTFHFPRPSSRNSDVEMVDASTSPRAMHLNLSDPDQRKAFMMDAERVPQAVRVVTSLSVNLDTSTHDEYTDYALASGLRYFAQEQDSDGIRNPHFLQFLVINVQGDYLFTQHTYTLASPFASSDLREDSELYKLSDTKYQISAAAKEAITPKPSAKKSRISKKTDEEAKKETRFKINSTEKATAMALLNIRGVKKLIIAHDGEARLELTFKQLLKKTITSDPGTRVDESELRVLKGSLTRKGEFFTENYFDGQEVFDHETVQPYPIRDYLYPAIVADECRETRASRSQAGSVANRPFGLWNMERIMELAERQDGEDRGTTRRGSRLSFIEQALRREVRSLMKNGEEWLVMTGKGTDVKLGWNLAD